MPALGIILGCAAVKLQLAATQSTALALSTKGASSTKTLCPLSHDMQHDRVPGATTAPFVGNQVLAESSETHSHSLREIMGESAVQSRPRPYVVKRHDEFNPASSSALAKVLDLRPPNCGLVERGSNSLTVTQWRDDVGDYHSAGQPVRFGIGLLADWLCLFSCLPSRYRLPLWFFNSADGPRLSTIIRPHPLHDAGGNPFDSGSRYFEIWGLRFFVVVAYSNIFGYGYRGSDVTYHRTADKIIIGNDAPRVPASRHKAISIQTTSFWAWRTPSVDVQI
ncbi:hypothetical protein DFH06DRAFT_1132558 [Mycena polygramma]|nr:hypothetical protein DFH06DRAFT_1132558 [Mycena polygramma]